MREWVSVDDRLPELLQPVVLININRYENFTGKERHVQSCGYLSEIGRKYWSRCGERAAQLNSFTHWMPLPAPPTGD